MACCPPAGDAYFDLDAAHFLLEELQRQRRAEAAGATAEAAKQTQQAQQQDQKQRQKQQQGEQQGAGAPPARAWDAQQAGAQAAPAAGSASGGGADGGAPAVLGHAVGPRWAQQLPAAAGAAQGAAALGAVDLEYGSEIAEVRFAPPQAACQGAPTPTPHNLPQQEHQEQQEEVAGTGWDCPLQLTLTNGRQVSADLVLLAIGVRPALEWAPPGLERTPDGGLRVNRRARAAAWGGVVLQMNEWRGQARGGATAVCLHAIASTQLELAPTAGLRRRHMQSSHPDVYAAGDSASCAWAADASRHWFQMRLWSQVSGPPGHRQTHACEGAVGDHGQRRCSAARADTSRPCSDRNPAAPAAAGQSHGHLRGALHGWGAGRGGLLASRGAGVAGGGLGHTLWLWHAA